MTSPPSRAERLSGNKTEHRKKPSLYADLRQVKKSNDLKAIGF